MNVPAKPLFRGRFHQAAFFATIPAGLALVALAKTPAAKVAAIIYALSLAGLYGTSAAYHRLPWSPQALTWMKRLDHSMIFVLIAGTYTPVALLVLHGAWSVVTLVVVWMGAAVGVVLKMVRVDRFRALSGALYIALGWFVVVAAPQMFRGMSVVALSLLGAGGLLYTGGSIVLAINKPNPWPRVFGYHEIWHSMVVAASACHFAAVTLVVLSTR
jgi:hemolysin III